MFLPFSIFGRRAVPKKSSSKRSRVGLIECLEDRITPAIVDFGDSIATAPIFLGGPLVLAGGILSEGQIGDGSFGTRDVDLMRFDVIQGATLRIETSLLSPNPTYDTFLRLFNAAGTEIAFDDDSGADNFSLINTGALALGTYYVGVSGFPNSGYNPAVANSGSAANSTGFYTLIVTDTSLGFFLDGIDANDDSGDSVSSAGDINGDGFDDLIIGARNADPNGQGNAGESYVVFGKAGGFTNLNLSTLNGTNGFVINGIDAYDTSGSSVSSAGDINGDGFDDLLIGAYGADPNNQGRAGESYVIFGKGTPFTASLNLSSLNGTNGFVINGIDAFDQSGVSVGSAGDINGDGFDDLIIGARYADPNGQNAAGESYVIFGKAGGFTASLNLSTLDGINGFVINGIDANDYSGRSVSSAGDINGDGFDDLVIGAWRANGYAGESYVVFGKASGFTPSLNLSSLNGTNGFVINGIDPFDDAGISVSSAGDINGDGFDDLLIGAPRADPNNEISAGESYVVFGKGTPFTASLNLSSLNGSNGFVINGIDGGDQSGRSVSSAGDINGDGFDDLLIGVPRAGVGEQFLAGETYIVLGKPGGFGASLNLFSLNGTTGFPIIGIDVDDNSGSSVSSAGDINGDGFDDLIIGADQADPNGQSAAGESYVIFGRNFTNRAGIQQGTTAGESINGTAGANTIVAGQGNDTIISGGGADVIYAGQGNDQVTVADLSFRRVDGGSGVNRLNLSGSNQTLNLTTLADNALINFSEIFITGSGNNTLIVAPLDVLNMQAQADTLLVSGNAGDVVRLEGGSWIRQADETVFGQLSFVYRSGKGVIKIPQVVTLQTPIIINLSSLNGTTGFVINGIDGNDVSGFSVSSAGDINVDGFDDLIIGARNADPNGQSNAGESYVVFGKAGGFTASLNLSSLNGTNGFVINGIDPNDYSGISVSSAGDINGDGFDDLIIGARYADPNGQSNAGESYVVFGKAGGFTASLNLSTLDGINGFVINGIDAYDNSGRSVSSAGDINGDGFDDLIIGARYADPNNQGVAGESYVVFGKGTPFTASLNLSSLNGSNGFVINGIDGGDQSGISVSSAGDINGDGFDDLLIGAPKADPNGVDRAGESYVVFGKAGGFTASLNLSTLNGSNGFVINGIDGGDYSGNSVSSAGDINGDGFDDLIISAPFADTNGAYAGESYVVFGKAGGFTASLNLSSLNGTNGFVINGIRAYDNSGISVSSAGDINGDGFDDLLIGARYADPNNQSGAGESYVVFGKAGGFTASLNLSSLNGIIDFVINGIDVGDYSGNSVSSAGDINGDGFDDLIIGARYGDPNGVDRAGESYVVFGRNFTNALIQQGTTAGESINGTAGANTIVAGQGNDTITGAGGADVIYAGQGNDLITIADLAFQRIDGGTGIDTLRLGNINLDASFLADNRLTNIEIIDLATTSGSQNLVLTSRDVRNIARTANELLVYRTSEDSVQIGTGWSAAGVESREGRLFAIYSVGNTRLLIQQDSSDLLGGGLLQNPNNPSLIDFVWTGADGLNDVSFTFDSATNTVTELVNKYDGVTFGVPQVRSFFGVTGNIILQGGTGDDVINAAGLGDFSLLGRSAPTLLGGGGKNSIVGSPGPDFISADGAEGADTINGGAGNDTIQSGGGADSVLGGEGNDNIVDGGEGKDTIDAGDGNDTINAGAGADSVIGGIGNDLIIGDTNAKGAGDTLLGGSGRDILVGGLEADSINGGADEDIVIAGKYTGADLALSSIMLEWSSARSFVQRSANILGTGSGPRLNQNNFLQVGTTVVNDNTLDSNSLPVSVIDIVLAGSTAGETDWLLLDDPIDTRADFQIGVDLLTDLSP
jgi:Ca2+-binding RTX toxin-like protein